MAKVGKAKADPNDAMQIGAPMAGMVVRVAVKNGDTVRKGDPLITLEAMKMETAIAAPADGCVTEITLTAGNTVEMGDLLVKLTA